MGEWTPTAEWYGALLSHRAHRRRSLAPVSVLAWRRRSRIRSRRSGPRDDWHGRVEVGRHPRAADAPCRRGASLVARRRAHHAPLSGDCRGGHASPRRHRARRRGARVPRRSAAALFGAPAAHRPAETGRPDGARGPGRLHGLRPARGRRRRRPAAPARRAPARARIARRRAVRRAAHVGDADRADMGGARARCVPTRARSASKA